MRTTDRSELEDLWSRLEIVPGTVLMCHSFLPSLGRLSGGPDMVVDTVMGRLGHEGTFVVPSFSYSYFRGELYDKTESPSRVGSLGDVVRRHPMAVRSADPNFSMAAIGTRAHDLMHSTSCHSFGLGSVYDQLVQSDLRVLLLGVDFTALALFMHLEKLHNVPYRHDETFHGMTRCQGKLVKGSAVHFVRDRRLDPQSYRQRIGRMIDASGQCELQEFRYGTHRHVSAEAINYLVEQELAKDPFFLIKEPVSVTGEAKDE